MIGRLAFLIASKAVCSSAGAEWCVHQHFSCSPGLLESEDRKIMCRQLNYLSLEVEGDIGGTLGTHTPKCIR